MIVRIRDALEIYRQEAGPKFASIVRRWLEWGGKPEDSVLLSYLRHLESEGLAPGSIDLHRRAIQAFYRRFNVVPPRARSWRYNPKDAERPALERSVIERMIGAAKSGEIIGQEVGLVCFSTTYGLRAGEMAAIRPRDLDWEGHRVFIRTLKGGTPRWTWLSPELQPFIGPSWEAASARGVEMSFRRIWDAAVTEGDRPERTSWHSIRRALVRDLVATGVPSDAVARFLRWSGGAGRGPERMVSLYSQPNLTVGIEGATVVRDEDTGKREYDVAVWDRHPYLGLWIS